MNSVTTPYFFEFYFAVLFIMVTHIGSEGILTPDPFFSAPQQCPNQLKCIRPAYEVRVFQL